MLFRLVESSQLSRDTIRSQEDDSVVVINPTTGQLLNLENDREADSINLDTDVFAENTSVQFRYDLLDCRIDICSPEVRAYYHRVL